MKQALLSSPERSPSSAPSVAVGVSRTPAVALIESRQECFAAAVAAVVESQRSIAGQHAHHLELVERARIAGVALHSRDTVVGGPRWSDAMVAERQITTELAAALHLTESDARRLLATSTALSSQFAATHSALASGFITYRHAETIVQHSTLLPDDALPVYEAVLLSHARQVTPQRLNRLAHAAVETAQPTTAIQRHLLAVAQRRLYLDPAADGMAYLTQFLPAVEAVAIFNRATDLARSAKNGGDPRTLTQLKVDALTDLMLNAETHIPTITHGIRAHVNVTVPVLTLLNSASAASLDPAAAPTPGSVSAPGSAAAPGSVSTPGSAAAPGSAASSGPPASSDSVATPGSAATLGSAARPGVVAAAAASTADSSTGTAPASTAVPTGTVPAYAAQLDGYGPIDRLTALTLTRDSPGFQRVLTDPMTGSTLTYGRSRYKPPADLDELIRSAHIECTFPIDCTSSATADLDHTIAWSEGGATKFGNLGPLCSSHHKVKHHTDWRIEQVPDGTITWTSPAGYAYVVPPTAPNKPKVRFDDRSARPDPADHLDPQLRARGRPNKPPPF